MAPEPWAGTARAPTSTCACKAPGMRLGELLVLGAALDDLLLPWPIDLQLHQVGITVWHRPIGPAS